MTQPAKHPTMGLPHVQGRCPACGWSTLFLGDGGYVTCSIAECPEPDAASTLLERPAGPIVPPDVLRAFHRHQHDAEQHAAQVEATTTQAESTPGGALAAYIADHPMSAVQAALRRLGIAVPLEALGAVGAQQPRLGSHAGATRPTSPTDGGEPVQGHASPADGHTAARDDALRRDLHTLADTWDEHGQPFAADDLRAALDQARTTEETP